MQIGMLFWLLMILSVLGWLGAFFWWPQYVGISGIVMLFVLVGLLGWKVFGPALRA